MTNSYTFTPANQTSSGGYYEVVPGVCYQLKTKPSAWNRFWCSVLLGWTWKEKL